MSHYHERKEKVCLNCRAALFGRYCHSCGQENIDTKETFLGLVTHFLYDITHFDGKFFSTVNLLLTKPGYLSREYTMGRRSSYLHPIRMYVFTSALFFLIFFSIVKFGDSSGAARLSTSDSSKLARARASLLARASSSEDSVQLTRLMDIAGDEVVNLEIDSVRVNPARGPFINIFNKTRFATKVDYDSAQKQLPEGERDGWFKKMATYKQIELNQKLKKDPGGLLNVWIDKLLHQFPQLLFLSLPFFALILQLLYLRNRQYYYSDHAIFTIHLYIFTFISILISLFFMKLQDTLKWNWLNIVNFCITLYILWYTYKAMRNFYGQSRIKTFVKYVLLSFLSSIVILVLFVIFFMLSIIQL